MSMLLTWNLRRGCSELICRILGFGFSDMMSVCKIQAMLFWVLFRGLGYPQLWPSPQCNEPLDVSKEFTFDVIDGILKGLLYSVLPCVSVIFNFQHSQWYFLFSPFLLSYHDINRRSFIIICIYIPSQQSAQVHYIPRSEWICWQGGSGACTSFVLSFGRNDAAASRPVLVGNQVVTNIHCCMRISSTVAILIPIYVVLVFYTL